MQEEEDEELAQPEGLCMHPVQAQDTATPRHDRRCVVASDDVPGCLGALTVLGADHFKSAVAEVRKKVEELLGRMRSLDEQATTLGQRQDSTESQAAELQRQQSQLSDEVQSQGSQISEVGRRQSSLEEDVERLAAAHNQSQTSLGAVETRTQTLEVGSQNMSGQVSQLKQQLMEFSERVSEAESQAVKASAKCKDISVQQQNARNWELEGSAEEEALRKRVNSMEAIIFTMESKLLTLEGKAKPSRSISTPY